MCFRTITLVNGKLEMACQQKPIPGPFDGIYYERAAGRLFVMHRDYDFLQEVCFSQEGDSLLNNVFSNGKLFKKSLLRSTRAENVNPFSLIKESFFTKPFNYRKHTFAYDSDKKILYKLQSFWKGVNGFEDKIISQKVIVYNLESFKFDCWGELKIENVLQIASSSKSTTKIATIALREAKQNKIVGLCAGSGDPWSLNVMYDNGFQIRLNVLVNNDKSSFSCVLQEFIGRTVDIEAKTLERVDGRQSPSADQQIVSTGQMMTKTYVGLPSIQAVVHKQMSDNMLILNVENKLSKIPAANRFDPSTCHIYPADKAHTLTLTTVLKVESSQEACDNSRKSRYRSCF